MSHNKFWLRQLLAYLLPPARQWSSRQRSGTEMENAIEREGRKLLAQGVSDCFVIGLMTPERTCVRGFSNRHSYDAGALGGDSVFQIGSLTKLFTVATLLSLTEDGHVTLDHTLADLLGDRVARSPRAGEITLRQLASHTSGLPLVPESLMALPRDDADPYNQLTRANIYEYLQTVKSLPLSGRVQYSNYGLGLLGHVLEDATGTPLEVLMEERIVKPLLMTSTLMTPSTGAMSLLVPGITQSAAPAKTWRFGALSGAGGLCSSVNDMLKFIKAHFTSVGPLNSVLSAMQKERGPNDVLLGWFSPSLLDRLAGNRALIWHNGRVGGYASYLSIDMTRGTGVVILSAKSAEITMPGVMLNRAVKAVADTTSAF